jgi:Family of unknown function (DUF6084)
MITFTVARIAPEPYALTPILLARLAIGTDEPVHAIALRCQVRIDPARRGYTDAEVDGLTDLFGPRQQWPDTQRSFLWQHATAMVPGFTGTTAVNLPLACTYDAEVTAAKYLHALRDGVIRLQFLFSGTIFGPGGAGFSVRQIPWDCDAGYDLPVAVWHDLMATHYPEQGFVRLRHDTVDALVAYKSAHGLLDLDAAVEALLDTAREEVP